MHKQTWVCSCWFSWRVDVHGGMWCGIDNTVSVVSWGRPSKTCVFTFFSTFVLRDRELLSSGHWERNSQREGVMTCFRGSLGSPSWRWNKSPEQINVYSNGLCWTLWVSVHLFTEKQRVKQTSKKKKRLFPSCAISQISSAWNIMPRYHIWRSHKVV